MTVNQNGYSELIERRNYLSSPLFHGVKAAKNQLHLINFKISQVEKNRNIFEFSFVHQKPGYTKSMVQVLVVQAQHGSATSEQEVQKYANWVIEQMSVGQ